MLKVAAVVVKDPCTCIVHLYCAPDRAKTGLCLLYPGVFRYREYEVFSTPFHELVVGAITL